MKAKTAIIKYNFQNDESNIKSTTFAFNLSALFCVLSKVCPICVIFLFCSFKLCFTAFPISLFSSFVAIIISIIVIVHKD